jgi:hypothetical protein
MVCVLISFSASEHFNEEFDSRDWLLELKKNNPFLGRGYG